MRRISLILALFLTLALPRAARPQETDPNANPTGINALPEVPLSQLSAPDNTPLGLAALAIRPDDWRHSETPHFILHFFRNFVAAQAAVELEYYYHTIATELHKETASWERKSNVYIFENEDDWHAFQKSAQLDPWTGGIHSDGNLFIVRNPAYKFEGRSLGHETTHLVLYRFFGAAIPLWLNEGYAENASIRFYAGLERERGYIMRPHSAVITASNYIPVPTLASMATYPDDVTQVSIFYQESQKLVAFLRAQGSDDAFITFLDALSHGSLLDTALSRAYGSRFASVDDLDHQFLDFAQQGSLPIGGN